MTTNFPPARLPGVAAPSAVTNTAINRDPALTALAQSFGKVSDLEVMRHCIGGKRVQNIPAIADAISNHIILICLDCEHWSNNTDETTEVGIGICARQDMLPFLASGNVGDHGENLMKQIKFILLRCIETSHLPCQNPNSRGVLGNRFGQGRFVTFAQARQLMYDLFIQPINNVQGVKGNHPIVVLGQDIGHDKNNLKAKAIAFDMEPIGTVVRYIDTQIMVRDAGYWKMPKNEQIGLKRLVQELWFEHSDPHTAANDAGRTLIAAFQIALGGHPCKHNTTKTMLEVANAIENHSVATFQSLGGVAKYCWKCGTVGHMKEECTASNLHCDECTEKKCKIAPGGDHVTAHCMCIATKKAVLRRETAAANRKSKNPKPAGRGNMAGRGNRGQYPRGGGGRGAGVPPQPPFPPSGPPPPPNFGGQMPPPFMNPGPQYYGAPPQYYTGQPPSWYGPPGGGQDGRGGPPFGLPGGYGPSGGGRGGPFGPRGCRGSVELGSLWGCGKIPPRSGIEIRIRWLEWSRCL
ncbi:hypothetical protein BDW02DRAFT_615394 [Decorospora gaudefroyi]|uniref:CCHC-type domain-containing protein n=1 Tax=Decorospora gaudefroyi TaxID=184978 RepID=A0A6A5K219_9PLEO|nr:hypothetical protein BDW02DRAFT_615394 [Decorospora gaudefroyi]